MLEDKDVVLQQCDISARLTKNGIESPEKMLHICHQLVSNSDAKTIHLEKHFFQPMVAEQLGGHMQKN